MRRRGRVLIFVGLAVLSGAVLWLRAASEVPSPAPHTHPNVSEGAEPKARVPVRPRVRRKSVAAVGAHEEAPEELLANTRCTPDYAASCHEGDVWLLDSCGRPQEKLEECNEPGCKDDDCVAPASGPCDEPAEGRCDGNVVRLCVLGRALAIDCAAKGMRCGQGAEGAQCEPQIPEAERCNDDEPARCEKETLVRCRDGRIERTECDTLRAKCLRLPNANAPTCVAVVQEIIQARGCSPCGCLVPTPGVETCDGRDQDGDGMVDQGLDCGAVPVHAFIVTSSDGTTSHSREDVQNEIDRANLSFFRTPPSAGLTLQLQGVDYLADSSLLTLDDDEVQTLASDPRIHPASDAFYVPMVFTDNLVSGETPKPGVSTLPNGTCGGMQEGQSPEVGLVAIAKARYPTTVTHELGHFFGLCHTFDQQEAEPFTAFANSQGLLSGCYASCRGQGDGICDTPYDPGPTQCTYDQQCQTSCQVYAQPDVNNLMSYYANCRLHFSDQQMTLMQHTVALRRGWNRCLGGACECTLGGLECPTDMSCRPVITSGGQEGNRCGFDGPRGAGSDCKAASDCGQGTICMSQQNVNVQRCARPCTASSADCTCPEGAGGSIRACLEDFGISSR